MGTNSGNQKLRDRIAPNTLITINGDIPDRKTGLELAEKYGIDGVMIGRGIFKNPFAFEKEPREHSSKEHLDLLRLQLDLQDQYAESTTTFNHRASSLFQNLCKRIPWSAELRNQLMSTKSTDEVRVLLDKFEASVDKAGDSETV